MALKKSSKRRTISVDMEGVESGGQIVEDGIYPATVHEIEEKESSAGNPMLVVKWKITGKKSKGALLWDNVSLTPQALWRFRGLLEAIGEDVLDSAMDIDLDDLVGKECRLQVENEKYEGKDRPRVAGYASMEDKGDEEPEEDDKPAKKSSQKSSKKDEDNSDDDADDSDDEKDEEDERPAKKVGTGVVKGGRVKFKDDKGKTVKGTVLSIKGDVAKVKDDEEDEWEIEISELESVK